MSDLPEVRQIITARPLAPEFFAVAYCDVSHVLRGNIRSHQR
jgi:hypothetical protein